MEFALSLGSNLGDRLAWLRAGRDRIAALPGVRLTAQAPVYETEPVGVKPEYVHLRYLNTVLVLEADIPVTDLHCALSGIEQALGRVREHDRFAPRTLDIDILYAGRLISGPDGLAVPHPRWAQRRFVLQPLCDVRPDLVLPGASLPVRDLLSAFPAGDGLRLYAATW